jgi:glycosyltransferase involved in cell wall biosynthesis
MRIIFYSPHPTHDIVSEVGYSTHQREIINALKQAGHEVITVIMGGDNPADHQRVYQRKTNASPIKRLLKSIVPKFIWTSLNNYKLILHDRKAAQALENAILKHTPDLLYERSEYLQDSGAKMARKYKLTYFLEVNAPFVEEMSHFEGYSMYHNKAHRIEKFKLTTADKVFSVSSALSSFLVSTYHCPENKIILQPNCINIDLLELVNANEHKIKQDLNIDEEKIIGFVGSIFPYHGVDLLIRAFARVFHTNPATRLLIVGDGSIMPELEQLTRELHLGSAVIFAGKIPHKHVFDYIRIMDICVMAKSNWYGSPVKIFEYGLMKKPIIAPDTSPVKDVMEHEVSGLIIDNEDTLAEAINQFLNNLTLAESCAENFHRKVIREYTWQKAADKIIKACA